MHQNIFELLCIFPVCVFGHQDDRAPNAKGQRRGNLVGLPDGRTAMGMFCQPMLRKRIFHGESRLKFKAAAQIQYCKIDHAGEHPNTPYHHTYERTGYESPAIMVWLFYDTCVIFIQRMILGRTLLCTVVIHVIHSNIYPHTVYPMVIHRLFYDTDVIESPIHILFYPRVHTQFRRH